MAKLFLTRSLVLGCLATTALGGAVAAQAKEPSLYFYPSEKWNVSASPDKGKSGGSNCTISSQFNNGYVVQFAGNADSFTNINVDFREDTFEEGKTYRVKLSVPGISEATIPSKAFEKNLIVSDLRAHKSFSQALIKASVLDLEIEGNAFRFYMTGLESALKDYKQCAGVVPSEKEVKAEKRESVAVTPPPEEKTIDLTDTTADKPNVQIREAGSAVKAEEAQPLPGIEAEEADGKPTSLQQKMAALAAMDSGQAEPKKIPLEEKKQEEKKEKPKPEAKKPEEPKSDKKTIFKTETKVEPTTPREPPLVKTPPKIEKVKSPEPKINKAPPVKMEADFTNIDVEKGAQPSHKKKRDLPPLRESRDIQPAAIQPVDDPTFVDMRNKISELEKRVLSLQDKNANLEEDLKETLNDSREERLSVSSDNWNLERATMRYNEAERQIERLGRQLQTLKAQCDADKHELEGMLFDPQVTNQQQLAKLSSLEDELDKAKADLLSQQRTYEERIKLLEERLK